MLGHDGPETPVLVQVPFPDGDAPPPGPVTVAVTTTVFPNTGAAGFAESEIVGVYCEIVMVFEGVTYVKVE